MIVCGEIHGEAEKQQIIALAEMLQFPILADPLSNLRNGEHDKTLIIDAYDSFLKDEEIKEALRPDAVIRFGPMPVSKPLFYGSEMILPLSSLSSMKAEDGEIPPRPARI